MKTTAFDLQMRQSSPSLQLHRLEEARDHNLWSVRVTRDIRIIVHRTQSSFMLCYVDHYGEAYRWAERRRLEKHPKTGAAQLPELGEQGFITRAEMFGQLAATFGDTRRLPFDLIVVDESQDMSMALLRVLAALGPDRMACSSPGI